MTALAGRPAHFTAEDVRARVSMAAAVDAVGTALRLASAGDLEQPPRLAMNDATCLVMAATRRTTGDAAVKVLRVRDTRSPVTGDAINGTLLWVDGPSGLPAFTADGAEVTALRTGAVSGVATDLLAVEDATTLTVLGSGRQAYTQALAVCAVRPIRSITVWSRTPAHAAGFADRLADELAHLRVGVADDPDLAVADADVVCAATASSAPLFDADAPATRAHINAVGSYQPSMTELPPALLATAELTVVDDAGGCRLTGELADVEAVPDPLVELGTLVGRRQQLSGRSVFKSAGCAALDWAIGHALAARRDGDSASTSAETAAIDGRS